MVGYWLYLTIHVQVRTLGHTNLYIYCTILSYWITMFGLSIKSLLDTKCPFIKDTKCPNVTHVDDFICDNCCVSIVRYKIDRINYKKTN